MTKKVDQVLQTATADSKPETKSTAESEVVY